MRKLLLSALAVLITSPAAAEVWQSREGECGEWRVRWDVDQTQEGVWNGTVQYTHVGGPCAARTGNGGTAEIEAVIAGDSFFAARQAGNLVCTYYGRIRGDRVRGFELCEGASSRLAFALRFPPGENRETRERYQGRDQDEFLDDPRTHDRWQPPPDFGGDVPGRRPRLAQRQGPENRVPNSPRDETFDASGGPYIFDFRTPGSGRDTIINFQAHDPSPDHDIIDLTGRGFNFRHLAISPSSAGGTVIGIPGGDAIILLNVNTSEIGPGDFRF